MNFHLFDTLLEPTFILNNKGIIIYCNEVAAILCDMSVRKLIRSDIRLNDHFQFETALNDLQNLENITEPTPYIEVTYRIPSGGQGRVQITIQPISKENSEKSWVVYFRDVTLEQTLQKKYRKELEQKEQVILDLQKAQVSLKEHSENLEKLVEQRTLEISTLNKTMQALLDSLHQGFFIFNKNGLCLDVYSRSCQDTLECIPKNKYLWDILKIPNSEIQGMKDWLTASFSEMLPFSDMAPLAPNCFPHSQNQNITLEYYPIRNHENKIEAIVGVANNSTELVLAQKSAEAERQHVQRILSVVKYRRQFNTFLRDSQLIINNLNHELIQRKINTKEIFRAFHTLKGGCATFCLTSIIDLCHQAETKLSEWKNSQKNKSLIELKDLNKNIIENFNTYIRELEPLIGDSKKISHRWIEAPVEELISFMNKYNFSIHIKESFSKQFLCEPFYNFVSHYSDVVQKIANSEGKMVAELVIKNKDFKILPEPYEALFASLIHAFRNAVDHGIETPEVRQAKGKPDAGHIEISCEMTQENGKPWLLFKIKDDGTGISPKKIRKQLIAKGISCEHENNFDLIQHVFDSEFSTKEIVTLNSGRGIGMDAILYQAKQLHGHAWIKSAPDKGTCLFIKVPFYSYTTQVVTKSKKYAA